jgi:3-hydroxybutyryl-CoA dehydrogenase
MRTVAMLANEAADAVHHGVGTAEDVDLAMLKGVNYPQGPLAWAEAVGLPKIVAVVDNLARAYAEDRYRTSPLLRRRALAARPFHSLTESGT